MVVPQFWQATTTVVLLLSLVFGVLGAGGAAEGIGDLVGVDGALPHD